MSEVQSELQEMRILNTALMQKNDEPWKQMKSMSQLNLEGNTSTQNDQDPKPTPTDKQTPAADGPATGGDQN
jgi:hypothetical protein